MRRVLLADIRRITKLEPRRLEVPYGHSLVNMAASARGEMAVPTSAAFKACCQVFGPSNVFCIHEYGSTQYRFGGDGGGTPVVMQKVYRLGGGMRGEVSVNQLSLIHI